MATLVRTISQLENLKAKPHLSSRIEVSEYVEIEIGDQPQYVSKNCGYGQLSAWMNDDISASMPSQYNLSAVSSDININNIVEKTGDLYEGNATISGNKTFTSTISTSNSYNASDDADIPNIGQTKSLIKDAGSYVASSDVSPDPFENSDGFAKSESDGITEETGYVRLQFSQPNNLKETNVVEVDTTGQLVMWGWLADNGNVPAELSWVRLEAKVKVNSTETWVPLQVQSWIQGTKSRVLQYVGFSVPVHAGLKLRVTTGFDVNTSNGAFSTVGSMTYRSAAEAKCGFFGYIIHKT